MEITYNGVTSNNLLTFSDVPNILKVTEDISGSHAYILFTWADGFSSYVTSDGQYYFTLFGETITNVIDPKKATNKRFYISNSAVSTAASFAKALNNCASIAVDYNIVHQADEVYVMAKTIGRKLATYPNYMLTNIPSGFLSREGTDGTAYGTLYNSKLLVDIYKGTVKTIENYVTTLEKNFYDNECSFDLSPILATMSEYGENTPYVCELSYVMEDGTYSFISNVSGSTTVGYHSNQSEKFLYNSGVRILMNDERGAEGKMKLYTYSNTLTFSTLCGTNTGGWTRILTCYNNANEVIYTASSTNRRTSSNNIIDASITIPSTAFSKTYRIEITDGSDTVTFNVIKPLKASEGYQRVYWRNEYGGISFFDFTGQRSETDSVDIETYEKNIFDYYSNQEFERKKIYKNDYKKKVKLKSHLMEEDGKWIFNSLMRSKKMWTEVNGKTYYIIPDNIEVTEDQNYNGIYTATFSYEYSDI